MRTKQYKILIVEDDGDTSEKLKRVLTNQQILVECAYNVEEAKKKVSEQKNDYKVVVMDLFLPKRNEKSPIYETGISLADSIYMINPNIKLIAVTKSQDLEAIRKKTSLFTRIYCKSFLQDEALENFVQNVTSLATTGKMIDPLPKIFIGSSVEGLSIAHAIQENLDRDAECTAWNQDIFKLSQYALESLITSISKMNYAIFVFTLEDTVKMRDKKYSVVRDNVIFEMGLAIGILGRAKVFCVVPRNSPDMHLPSDILGLTSGDYEANRDQKNLTAALGAFCNKIKKQI